MRSLLSLALLVTPALFCAAPPPIPVSEFHARREALRQDRAEAVFVLFGETDEEEKDIRTGFFQEANFYYLSGWREPGAMMLIAKGKDILFLPHHNRRGETYTGKRWSAEDSGVSAASGFDTVLPLEKFESELARALDDAPRLMTVGKHPRNEKLKTLAPMRQIDDRTMAVTNLRMKKSAAEIAWIEFATQVSMDAHLASWKRAQPGTFEYDVAGVFTGTYVGQGCQRPAYSPIVGSGPNSTVLHYMANSRRMDRGETLVIDAAAECGYYSSDITRTLPVGGKFTPRQRELYDIVLGAQKAALAAIKPGAVMGSRETPGSVQRIAYEYINTHGKDREGKPLGKYFLHGLGHHVGLDVHDPANYQAPLKAGMVLTLEPGIYIAEEGIGIRIEDVVLVTEDGARLLSGSLPREAEDVERALRP